jgi:N-acetylmuramoyl-L-alanine amidase
MASHIVRQGECLSTIARDHGFADWHTIYNHADNADLRKKRPNPHVLHPGDEVFIPDKQPKKVSCATGAKHVFVLKQPKRTVRLHLHDENRQPLASTPFELSFGDEKVKGTTDGEGKLEAKVPINASTADLKVGNYHWPLQIGDLNPIDDTPDEGVSGIQARLRNLGYNIGEIDGKIGPRTTAAIRMFQLDHPPLKVDGVCGPQTRAKLMQKHAC